MLKPAAFAVPMMFGPRCGDSRDAKLLLAADGVGICFRLARARLDSPGLAESRGGSAAEVLRDTADSALRARIGAILRALLAGSASGIAMVMSPDELARRQAFPGAHLVSLREGSTFGYDSRADLVTSRRTRGMPGY
jgi:hypothetical protein